MSAETWMHAGTLAVALIAFLVSQRKTAEKSAAFRATTAQRLQNLEADISGIDKQFELVLARWENGFRDRLNGQYARSMVQGVETQIDFLRKSLDQFREDYRDVVRNEAANAIQTRIEDLEAMLWQKLRLTPPKE